MPKIKNDNLYLIVFIIIACMIVLTTIYIKSGSDEPDVYEIPKSEEMIVEIASLLTEMNSILLELKNENRLTRESITASAEELKVLNYAFFTWAEQQGLIVKEVQQ